MGLLQKATNTTAFLKLGIYGFEGSGKTYTATNFAIGLTKLSKGTKVAFFDTEKGSDFQIERVKKAGLELFVVKSRTFTDVLEVIKETEKEGFSFLLIDSVTHIWRELTDAYLAAKIERIRRGTGAPANKKIVTNLSMKDWGPLKQEWARFSDSFVNSKIHIAACGRAGFEYDIGEDEEGKQEINKSGTKMKAEGEFGYESDLLLEMYKVPVAEVTRNKKAKGFVNRCIVLKDRTNTMNAKMLDAPKFENFKPIIDFLNIGGTHEGVDATRSSQDIFGTPDRSLAELDRQRSIALEELQTALVKADLDGRSGEVQRQRIELLERVYGTSSKTKIESFSPEQIMDGVMKILPVPQQPSTT